MRLAYVRFGIAAVATFLAFAEPSTAAELPTALAPLAPFPLVIAQSLEREFVAPGIERATYRLQTSAGPLVVSIVHVDPREPSVRFGTVLARDRIVSAGETVSSMAARTGAVAGINGDYFDIGNTNSPLGLLTQNGVIMRTPSTRAALTVGIDKSITFGTFRVNGTATDNGRIAIPVTSVNEWPPHGGATLLTPSYGVVPPAANTVIAELTPVPVATPVAEAAPSIAPPAGRYRVTQIDSGTAPAQPAYALALGPAAQTALTVLPDVGDLIDVALQSEPSLDHVLQAIGGGPALLANGIPIDDPASPGYADRARRIPIAAAARMSDGDLDLVVVDGRRPTISIGVDRAELIALLASVGATDAMQFDSGGSATLVARVLGEQFATVRNEPSDGIERPVADGFFVYSDAATGPPARLVVRPAAIEALPDTAIPLRANIVDAAGHPLGGASGAWRVTGEGARIDEDDVLHTGNRPATTTLQLERDGVRADLPLVIVPGVNKIAIAPERPDVDPGTRVALQAQAFDDRLRPVDVGSHVAWSALHGTVNADGVFTAGAADGFVTAAVGDVKSSEVIHVGRHHAPLPGFDGPHQPQWRFSSIPAGGPGSLVFTAQGTLQLSYDFSDTERAAYANAGVVLGEPLALSCAIDGDGQGAGVRVALLDRYGERSTVTFAKVVDWTGTQRHDVRIPAALAPPIVLQSMYVVGTLGPAPVKGSGTIGIRDCDVTLPGTPPHAP